MSSTRTKLTLDEKSFQGLLAAAFIVQEHNDRQKREGSATPVTAEEVHSPLRPVEICRQCGAPLLSDQIPCPRCEAENLRPGEQLQRTWASMWRMSQEQGWWPEAHENAEPGGAPPGHHPNGQDPAASRVAARSSMAKVPPVMSSRVLEVPHGFVRERGIASTPEIASPRREPSLAHESAAAAPADESAFDDRVLEHQLDLAGALDPAQVLDFSQHKAEWAGEAGEDLELAGASVALDQNEVVEDDAGLGGVAMPDGVDRRGFLGLRGRLRRHRADLYLAVAVMVAALALLWPRAAAQPPRLSLWERALVGLGVAEVPAKAVHYQGDPNIRVWVDPHAALYYCPGDELYGKSPDGHYTTQREAQSDRFEPAERVACE